MINEAKLREWASSQSFTRGRSYFRNGMIQHTVRRGNMLIGSCAGSSGGLYRIEVELNDQEELVSAMCSCPYDWGGICKHVVALVLTFIHEPERFTVQQATADSLMERSKEELVALIREMIAREPDLETLLDQPMPGGETPPEPADLDAFRTELQSALTYYGGWGERTAEQTVYSVARAAERFAAAGDWATAADIYAVIFEETLSEDSLMHDDEGEFSLALSSAVEGMADCLSALVEDDERRLIVLNYLLDAFLFDMDMGGFGMGESVLPEAILEYIKPADIPTIRERLAAAQARKAKERYGQWTAQAYADLLSDLDLLDNVDPEITLQRLRDEGMYSVLFNKLLDMNRLDEAVEVAGEYLSGPYQLRQILSRLEMVGRQEDAIRLARTSLDRQYERGLATWLAERYEARHDDSNLLHVRRLAMQHEPFEHNYELLKAVATRLGQWQTLRPKIINQLQSAKKFSALVAVYLSDEEWEQAWATLEQVPPDSYYSWDRSRLMLQVAERSRKAMPRRAIPVYVQQARRLIEARGRDNYAEAAALLGSAKELYLQIDEEGTWRELIRNLKEEFRRLPAFQDELRKARL